MLDVNYIVKKGEVIIVDEFTGRTMPGRRWSDGLHQAVEAKEGLDIQAESITLASVSYQAFFRCGRGAGSWRSPAGLHAARARRSRALGVLPRGCASEHPALAAAPSPPFPCIAHLARHAPILSPIHSQSHSHTHHSPLLPGTSPSSPA